MVDQIAHWLSLPPNQRRRWLGLLETVVLDDMSHPAFRRFKELYEPLGLRTEERALRYCKVRYAVTINMQSMSTVWCSSNVLEAQGPVMPSKASRRSF